MLDTENATVVVIDDDAGLRESLDALLSAVGYQCRTYPSAEHFLACAPPALPSCLLLDLHLPGMNGLELQSRISTEIPRLPVLFISGHASDDETAAAIAAGAFGFFNKPYDVDELLDSTAQCLNHSLHV